MPTCRAAPPGATHGRPSPTLSLHPGDFMNACPSSRTQIGNCTHAGEALKELKAIADCQALGFNEKDNAKTVVLEASDKAAAAAGRLAGRVLYIPCGDSLGYGQAVYLVKEADDEWARLHHVNTGVAWDVELINHLGDRVPRSYAEELVGRRDRPDLLFGQKAASL